MTRPMFPHTIDSTTLGAFRSCPEKARRTYIEHWKPQNESVHLVAGGAFASGIEAARRAFYIEGKPAADAVAIGGVALLAHYGDFEPPADSAKTADRMLGALEFYFDHYPLGGEGSSPITFGEDKAIEFSFAFPIDVRHPVTGDPILYTGRSDMIGHAYDGIYTFDEKTTSSLGLSWTRQWDLRSQFTGYAWAARQSGLKTQGTIVRGVSILKTKYDTQQVLTYRADWEIDRWYTQLCRDVRRMIAAWATGEWDHNLDHACTEYGGCSLRTVCKSPSPETWLPVYFTKRVWDPLARKELSVEEWEKSWEFDQAKSDEAADKLASKLIDLL